MKSIKKFTEPRLVLRGPGEEWSVVEGEREAIIVKALNDSMRRWIYQQLASGPVRQADILRRACQALGRKVTHALLNHHIRVLETTGLIRSEVRRNNAKILFRTADVRIQIRPRPEGEMETPAPESAEDMYEIIRTILRRKPDSGDG